MPEQDAFRPSPPDHAYQLLEHPQQWCQGAQARDALESPVSLFSPHATQWDVIGAIHFCYANRQDRMEIKFRLAYHLRRTEELPEGTVIAGYDSVVRAIRKWNDSPTTTHIDVLEALNALGI